MCSLLLKMNKAKVMGGQRMSFFSKLIRSDHNFVPQVSNSIGQHLVRATDFQLVKHCGVNRIIHTLAMTPVAPVEDAEAKTARLAKKLCLIKLKFRGLQATLLLFELDLDADVDPKIVKAMNELRTSTLGVQYSDDMKNAFKSTGW